MDVKTYEDTWDLIDLPEPTHDKTQPEHSAIALLSTLLLGSTHRVSLAQLLQQEFELCKGHANNSLATIRRIIRQEAFQYKKIL